MKTSFRFNAVILIICLLVNAAAFIGLKAQPVDAVQAKSVAQNFFADRLLRGRQLQLKSISSQELEMFLVHEEKEILSNSGDLKSGIQAITLYYIFNVKNQANPEDEVGFIIVSADQRISAVLGYSFTGEFPEMDKPSALKDWMNHYKEQIIYVIENELKPEPGISDEWKKYSGPAQLKNAEQIDEVVPLMTTTWSQYGYYNNLCPADDALGGALNGHVPAGCVAVAMAQIMRYWNYPAANNPIPGYTSINYGWQSEIGETYYDWSSMSDNVDPFMTPSPTSAEIDAVSTIVYHCGVAVQMNYGPPPQGSGAGSPLNAFKDYFKYSPTIQEIDRSDYGEDEWEDILRDELDGSRPVYYAGYENEAYDGGHSFVCDGYQDENYFHFNWGLSLGGAGNGYYYLDDLTPGSHNYNFKQWAIIGISPSSPLVDADGNSYNIVEIGSQVWMAENLKTTKYNDGSPIPNVTDNTAWASLTSDAYCWYNNDAPTYKDTYGALYNWYAVNSGNLCPEGWRVPSDMDFNVLENYLIANGYNYNGSTSSGNNYAKALAATTLWANSENEGAVGNTDYPEKRNVTGFTAVPSGLRSGIGPFGEVGKITAWWSSSRYSAEYPGGRWMAWSTPNMNWIGDSEKTGFSVRCLRDASEEDLSVDAGAFYDDIATAGEENWYKFLTGMAGFYAIQTHGSTDTYMHLYNSDRTSMIAEDNDGAGSELNSKIVQYLSADTWYYVKISGNNSITGIYSIDVNTVPEVPVADDLTITYDGLEHTAGAAVPAGISLVWYDAASGGNQSDQPAGINCGTYTAYAEAVNEATGCTSLSRTLVKLTITQVELNVTANDQSSQYSDPLQELTYEINGFVNSENISMISGDPDISTTATQFTAPGEYPIAITPGTLSAVNYSFNLINGIYTISQEDARVDYTGSSIVATTSVTSGVATITLRASVQDISASVDAAGDIYPGDIRNAKVRFLKEGAPITGPGTDADGWMIPVLVNPSDPKTGLVVLNWPVDIGSETGVEYNVGIEVSGFYLRRDNLDNTVVTVYKPAGEFITGGGYIINPDNTTGTFAGDAGLRTNFGFNVKIDKKGRKLKGNLNIIVRRTVDGFVHAYQIKSNSLTSLGVNTKNSAAKTAVFVSKVTMKDVTDPIYGYSKGGLTLQVNMTDRGEPGNSDAIAISVYDGSMLLFSSNWTGVSTDETLLGGGNLMVHSGYSLKQAELEPSNITSPDTRTSQAEIKVIAYPNPFNERVFFDLQLMTDSKVRIEIYDIKGSKIATVYNDLVLANVRYRFEYAPVNLSIGTLSYHVIVDGQQLFSGKLIHK